MTRIISAKKDKSQSVVIVILAGGLGNQLFQLAAALNAANGRRLFVDWRLGRPRVNSMQLPEVTSFTWPQSVEFASRPSRASQITNPTYFARKAINSYFKESESNASRVKWKFTGTFLNTILKIYFRKNVNFAPANGVGYFESDADSTHSNYVGYFQSYLWASESETMCVLKNINLQLESEEYAKFKSLILVEKPVIIHIRRGDYKTEPAFGLIPINYFIEAIKVLGEKEKNYWVFSDDPKEASDILSFLSGYAVRYIGPDELSPSETLQLMRYGCGYILSNSTFGWWSAFLRNERNAEVVVPWPWFQKKPSPMALIPTGWKTIDPWK